MSEVADTLGAFGRSRRSRLVIGVVAPAAALLLVGVGFGAYLLTRPATELAGVGCYRAVDLSADTAVVSADGRSATESCAELWRDGTFGTAAPAIQACVLESGSVGVFPGSGPEVCRRLGIAALAPRFGKQARRFAGVRDALVADLATRCVGEGGARRIVRRALEAHGFEGWTIETGEGIAGEGFSTARPCAGFATDGNRNVVTLVPEPRRR